VLVGNAGARPGRRESAIAKTASAAANKTGSQRSARTNPAKKTSKVLQEARGMNVHNAKENRRWR